MLTDPSISGNALSLQTKAAEGETVVRCTGRLTNETSPLLKSQVKALFVNKQPVILDLTDLSYMDSSGLGTLVGLHISAKLAGCELQLVNLDRVSANSSA